MDDPITAELFQPHLGTTFQVRLPDEQTISLVLSDVQAQPHFENPVSTRIPFSLIFRPPAGYTLRQGTYHLEGGPGAMEIFLVPVMPDREGPRLQAVFS